MAGQKGILIFEQGEDYLNSEIENSIRNLYDFSSGSVLFDAVVSRKGLVGHLDYEAQIDSLLQQYGYKEYSQNEEVADTRGRISKFLSTPDFIMLVNVKPFRESLGVQFNLFQQKAAEDSVADSLDYGRILTVFDKTFYKKGAETFFVNSGKNNHTQLIEQALSRLFPESQDLPKITVLVNENVFHQGDEFTFSIEDTIVLDATFSEGGNEKYALSYEWLQVYPEDMNVVDKKATEIVFDRKRATVRFSPDKPGKYFFVVGVADGVNKALSDTVYIEVISPVKLEEIRRSEVVDLYLWNPRIRQAGGRIVDYTFLNASNYSLGKDSKFSVSVQEAVNLGKGYFDVKREKINNLLNDSIKVDGDFFYIKNSGDSIVLKEAYYPPFVDERFRSIDRKSVMSLSYNGYESSQLSLSKEFRVHFPIQLSEKVHFSSIKFPSKINEFADSLTRKLSYTTTGIDLVLSESIRVAFFRSNKEFAYRDKFYENIFLDSFQINVEVPFYKSLEMISGSRLSYSFPSHSRVKLAVTLGLTKYRYLDGTLSDDDISIFQAGAALEGFFPGDQRTIERLRAFSQATNILLGGNSTDLSATAFVFGGGVEVNTPIWNWPIYLSAGFYTEGGGKELPFNVVNTLHFGVSVDVLAFFN